MAAPMTPPAVDSDNLAEILSWSIGVAVLAVVGLLLYITNGIRTRTDTSTDDLASLREDVRYLVDKQHEFESKGWSSLPDDLSTAPALTESFRLMQHRIETVEKVGEEAIRKLDLTADEVASLVKLLAEHDEWERRQKYAEE